MKNGSWIHEVLRALGLLTQLGLSMAACVLIGVIVGKYLDKWLGTSPWLLILCSFLGGAASIKVLYDLSIKEWWRK